MYRQIFTYTNYYTLLIEKKQPPPANNHKSLQEFI